MKNLKAKLKSGKGFTLIEMLIVVAIIAILIAIAIPMVNKALERAREATDAANERAAVGLAMVEVLSDNTMGGVTVPTSGAIYAYYTVTDNKGSITGGSTSAITAAPATGGGYGKGTALLENKVCAGKTIVVKYDVATGDFTTEWKPD